jgi:fucose permease
MGAVAYACGLLAPLATGLFLWLSLDWRYAVITGVVSGGVLVLRYWRLAEQVNCGKSISSRVRLPASFWVYWWLLPTSVSLEFCVLLWAPTFLEQVTGFTPSHASAIAAAFPIGVLAGRLLAVGIVTRIGARQLFLAGLFVGFLGFVVYWTSNQPAAVISGIFALGLGVAPLRPLMLAFAIGAAGENNDAASAWFVTADGLAILLAPPLLGLLADEVGLRLAHLMLPTLMVATIVCFTFAEFIQRRSDVIRSRSNAP